MSNDLKDNNLKDNNEKDNNTRETEKTETQARIDGYIPVDVESISVKTYLYDLNTMVDEMRRTLVAIAQMEANKIDAKTQRERQIKVIHRD